MRRRAASLTSGSLAPDSHPRAGAEGAEAALPPGDPESVLCMEGLYDLERIQCTQE